MLLLETERICKEVKRIGRDEYESCYVFFYCGLRNANRTCRLYRYKWRVIIKKSISTSVDSNMANVHDEDNSWGIINNDKPTCFCGTDIVKVNHKNRPPNC